MGLLSASMQLSSKIKLSFATLVDEGVDFFAEFKLSDNSFYIADSWQLDSTTILESYSSKDFWDGSIRQKNEWCYFSEQTKTLSQFYQFFSFDLKDKIKSLAIYYSEDEIILVGSKKQEIKQFPKSFAEEIKEFFLNKTNKLSASDIQKPENINVYLFTIDISECIDTIISLANTKADVELFRKSLSNEIHNRLSAYFSLPNCCTHKSDTVTNIAVFSKEMVKEELILTHLINVLSDFAQENSQLINIQILGKALSYSQLIEFLQAA